MGIGMPGEDSDDFAIPGGGKAQEHLSADNLDFIGHLLGNPLSTLNAFETFSDEGRTPGDEMTLATGEAKRQLLKSIDFLISRYAADIDAIPGLKDFLIRLRAEVQAFHWRDATQLFREAKDRFKF